MDQDETRSSAAAGALVATATGVAGLSGHPLESIIGAAAFALLQPFVASGFERIGTVLHRGGQKSGRTVEQLLKGLNESPAKQELLIRALDDARAASLLGKQEALADALAKGVESDSAAEGETEFLRVLADLDLSHVKALKILAAPRPLQRRSAYLGPTTFEPEDLGELAPSLKGREGRILAVLASHGLSEQETISQYDQTVTPWQITSFGREVLGRLIDAESEHRSRDADSQAP